MSGRFEPASYRIGVDVGGTFTDFTLIDSGGNIVLWKEDSTPDQPERAIVFGLEALAAALGQSEEELLARAALLVHGTTIATNTIIERTGPRVGLLCTDGFRDVLYFRDGYKPERFNIHLSHPPDFVERYLRIGVSGRIGPGGEQLEALDEAAVVEAARTFAASGVEAVAVAFLWSIVNPAHERRAAELIKAELPDVAVLCSADVLPEIREWQRTSATVLGAYILPGIGGYLRRFEQMLGDRGLTRPPLIMQINGGCASVPEILRRPVYALASGPAAAPAAAAFHAESLGLGDLIVVDMGGTSFDVSLITEGRPSMSRMIEVDGNPVGVAGVDVHSVGAGGGSIAWVDAGGALRVGPRSAGAHPGPACYGEGGREPTVTDANVVLGYLSPTAFLGGRRELRSDLADVAIAGVGALLELDTAETAAGIVRVVNANMVSAIRAVSIERGIDPRSYVMVVAGGAGGLHAGHLARELGIRRVLVPAEAGTFCAFGMTVTDVRHDLTAALHTFSTAPDLARLEEIFGTLEDEARGRLSMEGFGQEEVRLERWADARYPGQVHELTVEVPSGESGRDLDLGAAVERFHGRHEQQYKYARRDLPVEFLHWRVTAIGIRPPVDRGHAGPALAETAPGEALIGQRAAYSFENRDLVPTSIYDAGRLYSGAVVEGPAVVQASTTTVVVNEGDVLTVGERGSYLISITTRP